MNLRTFHLFFITLSAFLAVFLGLWALGRYAEESGTSDGAIAVLSLLGAAALITYGWRFRRRSRHW